MISVAMATCNGERFISAQIESIARQSVPVGELVICDDLSEDRTKQIVDSFSGKVPFNIRFMRNEARLFPHLNFERALSLATGDVVFLSDQDDVWDEHKVRLVTRAMAQTGAQACITDFWVCDQSLAIARRFIDQSQLKNRKDMRFHVHGCAMAFTKEFIQLALPFGELQSKKIWFDQWLSALAETLGTRVYINEPLHYWRRHSSAWSGLAGTELAGTLPNRKRWGSAADQLARCRWQLDLNQALVARLQNASTSILLPQTAKSISESLVKESRGLQRRIDLLIRRKFYRPALLLPAYASGVYKDMGGIRSAILDLIR